MGSVFVTDRKHKPKRTFTNGEDEDMYRYQQKLLEFNADVEEKHDKMYFSQNRPKLHPFDQLAVDSFKSAKEFFENADKTGNKEGISSEPSNVLRSELAEIGEKLAKENEGEEYSAAKDMQEAYYKSLSTSLIDQIYQTIPEHAFWDIKAPLTKFTPAKINKYNSARPPTSYTFFDYRNNEEWMDRFKKKRNLRDSISLFRTY